MNKIKWFVLLLLQVCLTACYEEDKLTPSGDEPSIFTKHEIDESGKYYQQIKDILEKYNTLVVYENFTESDLNCLATGEQTQNYYGKFLTEKQFEYQFEYLNENLFNDKYLPYELTKRLFKPYFYLVYDLSYEPSPNSPKNANGLVVTGKDFWSMGMQNSLKPWTPEAKTPFFPDTPQKYANVRIEWFRSVIKDMIKKKIIEIPLFLKSKNDGGDLDYKRPLTKAPTKVAEIDTKNPDFFLNRGFPGQMSMSSYDMQAMFGEYTKLPEDHFITYLNLLIRYTEEEMKNGAVYIDLLWNQPAARVYVKDHKPFMDMYYRVKEYMIEKYKWDLSKIPVLPTEIPDVPCAKFPDSSELGEDIPDVELEETK